MTERICSRAIETELSEGNFEVDYPSSWDQARLVPLVVPIFGRDGVLAAEADCYFNTNGRVNRKAVYRVLKLKGWLVHQRTVTPRPRVQGFKSRILLPLELE
jgi:hypothetical protein